MNALYVEAVKQCLEQTPIIGGLRLIDSVIIRQQEPFDFDIKLTLIRPGGFPLFICVLTNIPSHDSMGRPLYLLSLHRKGSIWSICRDCPEEIMRAFLATGQASILRSVDPSINMADESLINGLVRGKLRLVRIQFYRAYRRAIRGKKSPG